MESDDPQKKQRAVVAEPVAVALLLLPAVARTSESAEQNAQRVVRPELVAVAVTCAPPLLDVLFACDCATEVVEQKKQKDVVASLVEVAVALPEELACFWAAAEATSTAEQNAQVSVVADLVAVALAVPVPPPPFCAAAALPLTDRQRKMQLVLTEPAPTMKAVAPPLEAAAPPPVAAVVQSKPDDVEPEALGTVAPADAVVHEPKAVADPDVPGAARAVPLARNQVAMRATDTAASRKANLSNAFSEGPTTFSLVFINPHLLVR